MEVAGPVVPPGVEAGLGVERPDDVDEAPVAEPGEGRPFGRGDVGCPDIRLRIVNVEIVRGDVEVAPDEQVVARVLGLPRASG